MTLQEHIDHVKRTVAEIQKVERPIYLASQSAVAAMSKRIFSDGRSATGGQFSYNSTTPLYVNPGTSPGKGFKPAGKPKTERKLVTTKSGSRTSITFKDVTTRARSKNVRLKTLSGIGKLNKQGLETRWFPSYANYREVIGRENFFVNWELSGSLKFEIETQRPPLSDYDSIKSNPITPQKVSDTEFKVSVRSNENIGKLDGLMDKYPGVFELSKEERALYVTVFNKEFLRSLRERFKE